MADAGRADRSRAVAYALLALGALGGLGTASATWRRTTGDLGQQVATSGGMATGSLATVLAGVLGAGALLMLTLRAPGRRAVGVALALVAAGAVAVGIGGARPDGATWLPIAYAAAALAGLAGAVVTVATAGRWRTRDRAYARQRRAEATRADDDPTDVWKALDAGLDPTDPQDRTDEPRD